MEKDTDIPESKDAHPTKEQGVKPTKAEIEDTLVIPEGKPRAAQNHANKPTDIMFDKSRLERRKRLADSYVKHLDWGKAAKTIKTTKAKAEKLFNTDKVFRKMVADRLEKKAAKLELSDKYVIAELMAIVREAKIDKNFQASIKALELLGKHLKMFSDKATDNKTPISFNLNLGVGMETITMVAGEVANSPVRDHSSTLITIPAPDDNKNTTSPKAKTNG